MFCTTLWWSSTLKLLGNCCGMIQKAARWDCNRILRRRPLCNMMMGVCLKELSRQYGMPLRMKMLRGLSNWSLCRCLHSFQGESIWLTTPRHGVSIHLCISLLSLRSWKQWSVWFGIWKLTLMLKTKMGWPQKISARSSSLMTMKHSWWWWVFLTGLRKIF